MAKKPTSTEKAVKSPAKGSAKRILIIEDERPLAHALELKMKHEGYEVEVAYSGNEGLQKALSGGFDLILLDLIMPEMDGFGVMAALQDKGQKTPIIVLSNLGQDEDRARATTLGAKDYFVKANTPIAEIVSKVKSIL